MAHFLILGSITWPGELEDDAADASQAAPLSSSSIVASRQLLPPKAFCFETASSQRPENMWSG